MVKCLILLLMVFLLKLFSFFLNLVLSFLWGEKVPDAITNWLAMIFSGAVFYIIIMSTLYLILNLEKFKNRIRDKPLSVLKKSLSFFSILISIGILYLYIAYSAECNIKMEGIPNPEELKNQINEWIEKGNNFLQKDYIRNFVKFVLIPISVFYILFTVFREISMFKTWINFIIAVTMSLIFSLSPLMKNFADVLLSNIINLMGLILIIIILWKSWQLIRLYEHHAFANQWRKTRKFFHVIVYITIISSYGLLGMYLSFIFLKGNYGMGFLLGAITGSLISSIVWFEYYKLPYLLRETLREELKKLDSEIEEIEEKILNPETTEFERNALREMRESLVDRKRMVEEKIDRIEERIRMIEDI